MKNNLFEKIFLLLVFFMLLFFLAKNLNPFNELIFSFHDITQFTRTQEFTRTLSEGQFPPRLAPRLSFNLGFPVFNFYAPFAYYVNSALMLLGFSVYNAVKLSFLLALLVAFWGTYRFLKPFFNSLSSALGGVLLVSSPWLAVEIFIRGNLGEVWFIAILPFCLRAFLELSNKTTFKNIARTGGYFALLLLTHNALSFLSLMFIPFFLLFLKNKKQTALAFILGIILSAFFTIPAFFELPLTHARAIAQLTSYTDHFLCANQLWTALWGTGGSVPGCTADGMSFMLGKIQILLGTAGILYFIHSFLRKKIEKRVAVFIFMLLFTTGSVFLTLFASQFVWNLFAPLLSILQFPWRFLILGLFGLVFFAAYFASSLPKPFAKIIIVFLLFFTLFWNQKFFSKNIQVQPVAENVSYYLSDQYMYEGSAFNIPEYFPIFGNYQTWRNLKNQSRFKAPFVLQKTKSTKSRVLINSPYRKKFLIYTASAIKVNISYFPFWQIYLNGKRYIPSKFDKLARPIIKVVQPSLIEVKYSQTPLEKLSNLVSLIGLAVLTFLYLWPKKKDE